MKGTALPTLRVNPERRQAAEDVLSDNASLSAF